MKKILILSLAVLLSFLAALPASAGGCAPAAEDQERRGIVETLQAELSEALGIEAEFDFNWFGVEGGWAWVETEPRSTDGLNCYEPFLALLKKDGDTWVIVDVPALEEDSPPIDDAYFRGLMEAHPGLPEGIFPWGE